MACYTKITFRSHEPNNSDNIDLFIKGDIADELSNIDAFGIWRDRDGESPFYYDAACSKNSFLIGVDSKTTKKLVTNWVRTNLFNKARQDIYLGNIIRWNWPKDGNDYHFEVFSIETKF